MLLMVLVFYRKILLFLKQLVKLTDDKIQASIKQGEIDEAIATCDKQQGSVANAIKSLLKYQAVKKKDSIVKKLQNYSQRNRRSYFT
jgi:biopolymer transport protein ExbB